MIIGCIAAVLCSGIILVPVGRFMLATRNHMSVRERTLLQLPNGVHVIEHSRIGINPIVAEYSRDVTYVTNGTRGKTTPLAIDTCGGYPINCYLITTPTGPFLRLDDAVSEHLLDVSSQTTYLIIRVQGTPYVGNLSDERVSTSWSKRGGDSSTLSVRVNETEARVMADLTGDAKGVYIGRFDGTLGRLRFIPSTESPEIKIVHLRDG